MRRPSIRGELDETGAYIRSVSFGKTWVTGDVTPWLHALATKPGCNTAAIAQAAQSAAQAAGYDARALYDSRDRDAAPRRLSVG